MESTCVIWRVIDGKRGHERQTQGLAAALEKLLPATVIDIPCEPRWTAFRHWCTGTFPAGANLEKPDIILGAGHGTHLTMLAAKRAHGGNTIVLMRPSLPLTLFDLCLIPEHDAVTTASNTITTHGAINVVQPSEHKNSAEGLILIGGISAHYHWDEDAIIEQVSRVVETGSGTTWRLTTSPRTPRSTLIRLQNLKCANLTHHLFDQVGTDWLPKQLEQAATVWVSPDSVSMVYEALTSGAAVGLFDLGKTGSGRVTRGIDALLEHNTLTDFKDWQTGKSLQVPRDKFDEAARCARWIKDNWFPGH